MLLTFHHVTAKIVFLLCALRPHYAAETVQVCCRLNNQFEFLIRFIKSFFFHRLNATANEKEGKQPE